MIYTHTTNTKKTAPVAHGKVEDESVGSCQCSICKEETPVAYINIFLNTFPQFSENFSESKYPELILKNVLGMDVEMDSEARQKYFKEMIMTYGVKQLIVRSIDTLCDLLEIEWKAHSLSDDGLELNILCQLKCDYSVPDEYLKSSFFDVLMGEKLNTQQKRYYAWSIGENPTTLIDNFIYSLCKEFGVYVDINFVDTL